MSAKHEEEFEPGQSEAWDRLWDMLLGGLREPENAAGEILPDVESDYLN